MLPTIKFQILSLALSMLTIAAASAQIFPPLIPWKGKSELLIAKADNAWITPTEKSGFVTTPSYKETMDWFKKLDDASPLISMVSIGSSVEGRDIYMIIASEEKTITTTVLKKSGKPILCMEGSSK